MEIAGELSTLTSSLEDVAGRLSALVESREPMPSDLYNELVAAERTIGTLLRRLRRAQGRLGPAGR